MASSAVSGIMGYFLLASRKKKQNGRKTYLVTHMSSMVVNCNLLYVDSSVIIIIIITHYVLSNITLETVY